MITAYRSDAIRNRHRDEYDNALKAGGLADSIKCPHCSTEYSFIVPGTHWEQLSLIRSKVKEIAGYEHPGHSETSIHVPDPPSADSQ
jgi:hypothetical protein